MGGSVAMSGVQLIPANITTFPTTIVIFKKVECEYKSGLVTSGDLEKKRWVCFRSFGVASYLLTLYLFCVDSVYVFALKSDKW